MNNDLSFEAFEKEWLSDIVSGKPSETESGRRLKGLKVLTEFLGDVEAERFISLIQREPFDYTKWRQGLDEDLSIEEISKRAMAIRNKK
ncbi:MAG: hypothetical protein NG747_02680 [Candidatus Brocadia sp.]|nr:hypothetical protein [Candidatus Brocadia sp.]